MCRSWTLYSSYKFLNSATRTPCSDMFWNIWSQTSKKITCDMWSKGHLRITNFQQIPGSPGNLVQIEQDGRDGILESRIEYKYQFWQLSPTGTHFQKMKYVYLYSYFYKTRCFQSTLPDNVDGEKRRNKNYLPYINRDDL